MLGCMDLQTAFNWRCVVITMVTVGLTSLVASAAQAVVLMVSIVHGHVILLYSFQYWLFVPNIAFVTYGLIFTIVICLGGSECLSTSLDLDRLCSEVMTAKSPCLVGISDDAGRLFFVTFLDSYVSNQFFLKVYVNFQNLEKVWEHSKITK